jgi:hypothetical protein
MGMLNSGKEISWLACSPLALMHPQQICWGFLLKECGKVLIAVVERI